MTRTNNFAFNIIDFDKIPWSDDEHENWYLADAVFARFIAISNIKGIWKNATAVVAGDKYVDSTTSVIYTVLTDHVTASTGTFADDRAGAANDYWEVFSEVELSKSWATFLGGLVNAEDYSSKAYAIGTATELSAGSAKRWATEVEDTPVLGSFYSALHYAAKAATSASAAAASETIADAAATQTALDVITTNADVVSTNADAVTCTTKASEASTSASNAATSETNAATSEANAAATLANALTKANNLSDVNNATTARSNLGLVIGTDVLAPNGDGSGLTGITGGGPSLGTNSVIRTNAKNIIEDITLSDHSTTFTADAGADTLSVGTDNDYANEDTVYLTTTGTLPAGLSTLTQYYVVNVAAATLQLSATNGGAAINITDAGSGTHTIYQAINGSSVGPITVESGHTVTIPEGSTWSIV